MMHVQRKVVIVAVFQMIEATVSSKSFTRFVDYTKHG